MILKKLFEKSYPRLDWIQAEVSSFCNANCIYCPHTEYRDNWQNRLLSIDLFKKLIPAFDKTKLVYLQGWGEPFTHPHFMKFLSTAKKAGCMVGTTTNGTMLDSEKINELIDGGLDIIGFSLAGVDEKNNLIRKGTQISKVLKCIDEIHRIKNSKSVENPKIHIAYMLLRSGVADIHKLPAFVNNAGIDQTVISSLSLVVNESLNKETLLASGEQEHRELLNVFDEIRKEAESINVDIAFNIVSPVMKESFCTENIERGLFIGADGVVSPCVMGLIPVMGDNFYYFRGYKKKLERFSFGNIAAENLNTIWHKKEYKKFIQEQRNKNFVQLCKYCQKRFIMDFYK